MREEGGGEGSRGSGDLSSFACLLPTPAASVFRDVGHCRLPRLPWGRMLGFQASVRGRSLETKQAPGPELILPFSATRLGVA